MGQRGNVMLGHWPGYVNFTKVILRGCDYKHEQARTPVHFDWLFEMSTSPRVTASKANECRIGSLSNDNGN